MTLSHPINLFVKEFFGIPYLPETFLKTVPLKSATSS
jgi:hypothetical protein